MENYSKIFAENLRHYRKLLKLTQEQLAEKCNVSHTTIDTLEKGYDFRTKKPAQAQEPIRITFSLFFIPFKTNYAKYPIHF